MGAAGTFPPRLLLWRRMNLLSIQSHVAYGHVGNSAAVFALERIGVEVWPVHTVQFSNHTGYGKWGGQAFDPGLIHDVVRGIEQRGVLAECDGVLSGYIGSADVGDAILDAVAIVKRANPAAKYCCDPVIGDAGRGLFVPEGVAEFMMGKAVPAADIITPNQFELEYTIGRKCRTLGDVRSALAEVHALGPRVIMLTSLDVEETPEGSVDLLASDAKACVRVRTPRLPQKMNGAGDTIAALFFAHYLRGGDAGAALSKAASAVFGVLAKTADADTPELQLIAAQDELVNPSRTFDAEEIAI